MKRAKHGFMPRESTRRARVRRTCRAMNVSAVALGLWWLGPDDRPAEHRAAAQATAVVSVALEDAPSLLRKVLSLSGLADGAGWAEAGYVPSSNQRVLQPDEWCDPELKIIEPDSRAGGLVAGEQVGRQNAAATKPKTRDPAGPNKAASSRNVPKGGPKTRGVKARKPPARSRRGRREWFTVTAYCPCKKCCGRWARYHRTALGLPLSYNGGHLVAADTRVLPFHTEVRIPGYAGGRSVPVVDRGAVVQGRMLDVFFATHWRAKRWGRKRLLVHIVPQGLVDRFENTKVTDGPP